LLPVVVARSSPTAATPTAIYRTPCGAMPPRWGSSVVDRRYEILPPTSIAADFILSIDDRRPTTDDRQNRFLTQECALCQDGADPKGGFQNVSARNGRGLRRAADARRRSGTRRSDEGPIQVSEDGGQAGPGVLQEALQRPRQVQQRDQRRQSAAQHRLPCGDQAAGPDLPRRG